jgi:hypothetical protein
MDDRQAFKAAFIAECIADGHTTPEQVLDRAEQVKAGWLGGAGKAIGGLLQGIGGAATSFALPAALAAPPIIGAVGGHLAAKAQDVDEDDVASMRRQEMLEELRRQTAKLQRRATARRLSAPSTPRSRAMLR